ncbi:transglycosylase [Kitasatospora xanthocidica]|uniref:NlpC/P60 family protein n=1 Tax=Kitasatospora xanthocidica TaxID=83382 RepID=UPI0019B2B1AD|nr:NlpC/P60 family protein [Kitasatospora xanthocidica]GHF88920.1 transglycosylase [Kitasatospora xanthocidica]
MRIKAGLVAAASAAAASPLALGIGLVMFIATAGKDTPSGDGGSGGAVPVASDTLRVGPGGVPEQYAGFIRAAAAACDQGLSAGVIAAQINAESAFDPRANSGQAQGIAQFTPETWASWGEGGSVWEPRDAIAAQGRFMCSLLKTAKQHPDYNGSPIELALAGYNAGWGRVDQYRGVPPASFAKGQTYDYVKKIMADVRRFTQGEDTVPVQLPPDYQLPADTPPQVRTAVAWALAQRGGWYQWGGDCTDPLGSGTQGRCDCSSLMQQAYSHAGVTIPRTTFEQVKIGTRVGVDDVKPGDLVFNAGSDGSDDSPGHVGMYVGNGWIVEAPRTGVQTRTVAYSGWRNSTAAITRITHVVRVVKW